MKCDGYQSHAQDVCIEQLRGLRTSDPIQQLKKVSKRRVSFSEGKRPAISQAL